MATKKLDVYYKKQLVGTLAERPNKQIAFQYSADWQKNGFSISPIALPLKNDVFTPPEKNSQIFTRAVVPKELAPQFFFFPAKPSLKGGKKDFYHFYFH